MVRFLNGNDKKFVIPVYQRAYSWKKGDCELLLSDLESVYEKGSQTHFFGSIVYVANNLAGYTEYIIIDGQQRITTVSLLLLAIRNYLTNSPREGVSINTKKITTAYLTDEYAEDEKKLKLKLIEGDDYAYDQLISNSKPVEGSLITANYQLFYDAVASMTDEQLSGLYDAIMKLEIVHVSLEPSKGDDPQLVFESLNSTGQKLLEGDKIRNYVLMNMTSDMQEKFYKKYWEPLENTITKNDIDKFIRYFLSVKNHELASDKNIYFEFKSYAIRQGNDAEAILQDMLMYAEFYKIIKTASGIDNSYNAVLARINKLEINMTIPLMFDLFAANKEGRISVEELTECFQILESYLVRRIICGLSTNALNKLFVGLALEIDKYTSKDHIQYVEAFKYAILSKRGKSRFPNDHDFRDKFSTYELYNAKPYVKKYILERLENWNNREQVAVEEQIDNGTLTIEHIMPQTLTDEWKEVLGDSWELVHTKYIDTPGNLTLSAYNSDYSNLSFQKKKNMPEKGFIHSKLQLNAYLKKLDKWDEEEIVKRAEALFERALQIWSIPSTDYSPVNKEDIIYWDDEDFDFTNKRIVKMVLFGDAIMTTDVTDAYKKINMAVYKFDPSEYMKVVVTTTDKESIRSPFEIAPGIYITTNLSSQVKIANIQKLFESFEFESKDLQFEVRDIPKALKFDINDEATFVVIKVGELAKQLLSKLLLEGKLPEQEITLLHEKGYSKKLFPKNYYPVLADDVNAYKGNGKTTRFYKESVVLADGRELFISSQWFEDDRDNLMEYYRKYNV
ncbi:MAG: DUF262 domain-containing protein [Lachnospiraceae bacterium]|nr:DUF262 domain-containing protein [Lachnospiraceae bacterium]